MPASPPRLLVSVRSVEEARAAIAGGCDLLDVKEPARGSLGAADRETIAAICEAVAAGSRRPPISVALGELAEWTSEQPAMAIPTGVELVKLGLSGCGASSGWPVRWKRLRAEIDAASEHPPGWIAVYYADAAESGSPGFETLLDLAASTGCRGLLVDTFHKNGRGLLDHLTPRQLGDCCDAVRRAELTFAVAGSLTRDDLDRLGSFRPDILAIRGAACRKSDRTSAVDEGAVRRFREAMAAVWANEPSGR